MQEISGDNDAIDTGAGMTEVDEGVVEGQEIALKTTGDVTMKGNPVDKDGFGDVMVDETLVVVMAHEATLVMADEAHLGTAHETTPVIADEAFVGMADEAPVTVMADPSLTTIAESATMDSHDQDANFVDLEQTTSNEPQPLQIIPFSDQYDGVPAIDSVESCMDHLFVRMASIMEGISAFGAIPCFERVLREESSLAASGEHSFSEGVSIGS